MKWLAWMLVAMVDTAMAGRHKDRELREYSSALSVCRLRTRIPMVKMTAK
ncbi:MAG: hypothetical protein ABIF77_08755 [bacterium]